MDEATSGLLDVPVADVEPLGCCWTTITERPLRVPCQTFGRHHTLLSGEKAAQSDRLHIIASNSAC